MTPKSIEGFRLSPQQRRLYLQGRSDRAFVHGCVVELQGELDRNRLERAFATLVERHEILRTRFRILEGAAFPLQEVTECGAPPLEDADEGTTAEALLAAVRAPFPLADGGPPLRARVARTAPDRHLLALGVGGLCADAASLRLVVEELVAAYAGELPTAGDVLQYPDVAQWQNELLEELDNPWDAMELEQGEDPVPAPVRTGAAGREAGDEFAPEVSPVAIEAESWQRLDEVAGKLGASRRDVVLTAWLVWAAQLREDPAVRVGLGVDGRPLDELAGSLGPLAKTVPITVTLPPALSFAEAVGRVSEAADGARTNQEYFGLERRVEPRRAAELYLPLVFEVAAPIGPFITDGLRWSPRARVGYDDCFDLALRLVPGERAELHFDPRRCGAEAVERAGALWKELLTSALEAPSQPLADLPLVGSAEARHLAATAVGETSDEPPRPVHELFVEAAGRHPERPALRVGDERLSYGELAERSARLAHHLRRRGIGPDDPVVLCLERSASMVVALLAVLEAGGAFAALDPDLPPARLGRQLRNLGDPPALTQESLVGKLGEAGARETILLDRDGGDWADLPATPPSVRSAPANLAYLLFTSGSTGHPKAVAVSHGNLAAYRSGVVRRLGLAPPEEGEVPSFATATTLAADLGHTAIFPALTTGATLHVLAYEVAMSGESLARYQQDDPLDVLKIVPSHLAALIVGDDAAGVLPRKLLVLGGEAPSEELLGRVRELRPSCRVVNHYGPTEATVGALTWEPPRDPAVQQILLGRPLPGMAAHVVDPYLRRLPAEVPGELCLGGAGIARGYRGQPARTAERFVADPFSARPGDRLYRTGDQAVVVASGEVRFLGRLDHQVKVRGFRIELGEIETALAAIGAVKSAVVTVHEGERGRRRLVAYLVLRHQRSVDRDELAAHLRRTLPDYMVPTTFVFLPALPLTANGKIDRSALPAPEEAADSERHHVPPRTELERRLAEIWSAVLGIEDIGVEDDFLRIGGDSILSIRVVARARQAGLAITPRQVFDHPTIAGLARVIGSLGTVDAEQGTVTGEMPLTPIQRWFFEQDLEEEHHFDQAVLLALREPFEPALLERAVDVVVDHHDALRTRFPLAPETEWGRRAIVEPRPPESPYRHVDLSGIPPETRPAVFTAAASDVLRGFDLDAGRVFAAVSFGLESARPTRLLLAAHHLVVDGVSWRVLLEDLQTILRQVERGGEVELAPKSTSFKRWGELVAEHAAGEALAMELAGWESRLAGSTPRLPRDLDEGPAVGEAIDVVRRELSREETGELLQRVPRAFDSEINEALLGALAVAIGSWTGGSTCTVELEGHGREPMREDVDLSRTVGWFTSRFPVHLEVRPSAGPVEALRALGRQLRRVPSSGVGYGMLRYASPDPEVRARLAALPEPEVSFNYLGQFDEVLTADGPFGLANEPLGPTRSPSARRRHLLSLDGGVTGGVLRLTFTYSTRHHRRGTVERLADEFMEGLRTLIRAARGDEPRGPSSDVDLDEATLSKILQQVGDTGGREER